MLRLGSGLLFNFWTQFQNGGIFAEYLEQFIDLATYLKITAQILSFANPF